MIINGTTVYETVGSRARSGTRITLRLRCAKSSAYSVYGWFTNGAYYASVGTNPHVITAGWFDEQASSLTYDEGYATISLVFEQQNVQGLTITDPARNKYDPVYSLGITMAENPIEQHPDFLCSWAYNLYELVPRGGSASAVPAWAATDTNPNAIHAGYLWSRMPPISPDPAKEYIQVQAATKPGQDIYLIPRPSVTSTIYYRSRTISNSDIVNGGKLKAPPQTYIYPNTQTCWLVQPSGISEVSDDLMAVTTTYVYAEEGWDTDIYPLAT